MKRTLLALVILSAALLLVPAQTASAQGSDSTEPFTGRPVCFPDVYLTSTAGCLPAGPSHTLTEMAKQGLSYPPKPIPAVKPPRELTINPAAVAKINLEAYLPANVYATMADAVAGTNPTRQIAPGEGLRFVSYIREERVEGKAFVMLKSGEWMRASPAGYSYFQGLQFHKTPSTGIGWMIDTIRARSAPSWTAPEVGETLYREAQIQIYQIVEVDDMEWFMVGPGQWVPWHKARRLRIDTTPPEGVPGDRWISINLHDQTIAVYEDRQLVFATLIATGGEPYYTRPGLFQIYQKKPLETMSGAFEADRMDYYYLEDVPWTMYFDEARAIHGAYWRSWFGVPGTHGCVNLSIGDSAWLFEWAEEGDWVYVWDPSGLTPTDPSLYGAGGA
jgi:hypothetical protein